MFYEAFVTREIIDELRFRKIGQINALWANTNLDPQKEGEQGPRMRIIEQIEEQFKEAVSAIRAGELVKKKEDDELKNNPFFAPVEKGLPKI